MAIEWWGEMEYNKGRVRVDMDLNADGEMNVENSYTSIEISLMINNGDVSTLLGVGPLRL